MARAIIVTMFLGAVVIPLAGVAQAVGFSSIQLVGSFNGITCEPEDPANDMDPAGTHAWRKLKFINEPGDPDTILFKFTADNSYMPGHWGWSLVEGWGIADFGWSPPGIAAVLPDSGYWYFNFNDSTNAYWLDRPDAAIGGVILAGLSEGVPAGTRVALFDQAYSLIGIYEDFTDSTFAFSPLPESTFHITASAPGYRDTTVTGIGTRQGETEWLELALQQTTAVMISAASARATGGGIVISWIAGCCDAMTGFDIFRGESPRLELMTKRNQSPVRSSVSEFSYFDTCDELETDHYYYIVEAGSGDPALCGPIRAAAFAAGAGNSLGQNYPNPFNPATTIPYHVSGTGGNVQVLISFYDVAGRKVARYDLGVQPAGDHVFEWNPSLSGGGALPSGVYYCRLQAGKEVFTRKMIMLR